MENENISEIKIKTISGIIFLLFGKFPFWRDMGQPSVTFYVFGSCYLVIALFLVILYLEKGTAKEGGY